MKLPSVASIWDRNEISDRAAAVMASAGLHDLGIIAKDDKAKVIDWMKIRQTSSKNIIKVICCCNYYIICPYYI